MFETDEKDSFQWRDYADIIKRRRWWVILPIFSTWMLVWVGTWFVPAKYRSEAVVLVERQAVPQQFVTPNVTDDVQTRLQGMTQQILSRTRLERIIDNFHLYAKERAQNSMADLVEKMRSDISIEPQTTTNSVKKVETTSFKISYAAQQPQVAQQVTSQLTSLFIEENLQERQQQSESTTQFLENQLEEARKQLADQEEKVSQFKSRNIGALPEQTGSNLQILAGLQGRYQSQVDALNQAKQQRIYLESLRSQYQQALQSAAAGNHPQTPAALAQEVARQKDQLAQLTGRYTEKHPDVQRAKEQLAAAESLQEAVEKDLATASKTSEPKPTVNVENLHTDPQTTSAMMKVEGELQANAIETQNRAAAIQNLESQIGAYQGRLNTSPLREQQMAALTRDYDQSLANYQSLLAKKMQSELATNLEKRQQGEQFQLIDPPTLPRRPESPDRLKLSVLALALGLVFGVLFGAGSEFFDDRIRNEDQLNELIDAKVLATIPTIHTLSEARISRKRVHKEWLAGAAMLMIVITGNVIALYR